MIEPARLFVALGETPLGLFMRDSSWAFATTESAHLLALAVVGGAVTLLGLAALGLGSAGTARAGRRREASCRSSSAACPPP